MYRRHAFAAVASTLLLLSSPGTPLRAQPPAVAAPVLHGDTWAATQKAGHGTLVIAYFYPLEGFVYRDAGGHAAGLLIDMVDQFRSYLKNVRGADVTLQMAPYEDFTRFYDDVRAGQGGVVGLAGTTITPEREKEVSFGPPFFANIPVLVTNKAVPQLTSRERMPQELAGFTALAFKGTTDETYIHRLKERMPALKIETITDFHDIIKRLSQDPKTFSYLDLNIFWTARKQGAPVERHRVADMPREDFGFVLPKGSDWVVPLREFFAANGGYRASRAYRSLMIKHLGVDLKELLETGG